MTDANPSRPLLVINSVNTYLPPVEFFLGRMVILVQGLISQHQASLAARKKDTTSVSPSSSSSSKSFASEVNQLASSNEHFQNLCSLIFDFHKHMIDEPIILRTNPKQFFLVSCPGSRHDDSSSSTAPRPSLCLKASLSQQNRKVVLCINCRKDFENAKKREKRKAENGHLWLDPSSNCNLSLLSPADRERRMKRRRMQEQRHKQASVQVSKQPLKQPLKKTSNQESEHAMKRQSEQTLKQGTSNQQSEHPLEQSSTGTDVGTSGKCNM